jgi:hypothetical protein
VRAALVHLGLKGPRTHLLDQILGPDQCGSGPAEGGVRAGPASSNAGLAGPSS